MNVSVALAPERFGAPAEVLRAGAIRVESFRYRSGIEALRIVNGVGELVVLPFTGQQIWDAELHGRRLTMRTAFDEPVATTDYLAGNGAYFIHCGGSAMGNPGPQDSHPLHGELPYARLDEAWLTVAEHEDRTELTVHGSVVHRVSFGPYFRAELALRVTEHSGMLESRARLTNLSGDPQPLMYLAHINYRPAVGGTLDEVYTDGAEPTTRAPFLVGPPGHTVEHTAFTGSIDPLLAPGIRVEPELVQTVPLRPVDGTIRSEQVHPDGSRDIVEAELGDLTHVIRWLHRSADDDAFGFALPATAEPDGFSAEDRKGNVRRYPTGAALTAVIRHGALPPKPTATTNPVPTPTGATP